MNLRSFAAALLAISLGGCSGHPGGGGARRPTATQGNIQTVFVIMMENHNWSDINGSESAPYINNTLLPMAAHAENYFNPPNLHPSLPNYLWLEAGTNFGVTDDNAPSDHHQGTSDHLVSYLENAVIDWRSYQEDIDGGRCPLGDSGLYSVHHNPMVYFDDVTDGQNGSSPHCINHVRPYSELAGDLSSGNVAPYNFITPNLCNDMHGALSFTCLPFFTDLTRRGDDWLASEIPKIMGSQAYQQGGAIFITWDESENGENPIGMIALSPFARSGYASQVRLSHSSTLLTMEEIFGVGPLLGDAANATDLSDLFASFP